MYEQSTMDPVLRVKKGESGASSPPRMGRNRLMATLTQNH